MDKRTLLAFALMLIVYLAWMTWFVPPAPVPEPEPEAEEATVTEKAFEEPAPIESPQVVETQTTPREAASSGWLAPAPDALGGLVRVETDLFVAEFDRAGADLQSFRLKKFRTLDRELVELVPERSLDGKTERAHELSLIFEDGRRELLSRGAFRCERQQPHPR